MRKLILLALLSCVPLCAAFCAPSSGSTTAPDPYEEDEFPRWAQDIRRFEIITLGSIPFTMMGTTLAYSGIMTATGKLPSFPNPFDKTSASLSTDDQFAILGIAAGVSVCIGITDLIITLVRRASAQKALDEQEAQQGHVTVTPYEARAMLLGTEEGGEAPDAVF